MPHRHPRTVTPQPPTSPPEQPSAPALGYASLMLTAGVNAIPGAKSTPVYTTAAPRIRPRHPLPKPSAALSVEQEQRRVYLIHETALLSERIAKMFKEFEDSRDAYMLGSRGHGMMRSDYDLMQCQKRITECQEKYDDYHWELEGIDRLRGTPSWGQRLSAARRPTNQRRS
jgi:hypothetical protein